MKAFVAVAALMLCIATPQVFAEEAPLQDETQFTSMLTTPYFEQGYLAHHVGVNPDALNQPEQVLQEESLVSPTAAVPEVEAPATQQVQPVRLHRIYRRTKKERVMTIVLSPLSFLVNHPKVARIVSIGLMVGCYGVSGQLCAMRDGLGYAQQAQSLGLMARSFTDPSTNDGGDSIKINRKELVDAGSKPRLRYTVPAGDLMKTSLQAFDDTGVPAYKDPSSLKDLVTATALELGLTDVYMEVPEKGGAIVTLEKNERVYYNPNTGKIYYASGCHFHGKEWANRIVPVKVTIPQPPSTPSAPLSPPTAQPAPCCTATPNVSQTNNGPVIPGVIRIEGLPQPAAYPPNMNVTYHVITENIPHETRSQATLNYAKSGFLAVTAVAEHRAINAVNHASDNGVHREQIRTGSNEKIITIQGQNASNLQVLKNQGNLAVTQVQGQNAENLQVIKNDGKVAVTETEGKNAAVVQLIANQGNTAVAKITAIGLDKAAKDRVPDTTTVVTKVKGVSGVSNSGNSDVTNAPKIDVKGGDSKIVGSGNGSATAGATANPTIDVKPVIDTSSDASNKGVKVSSGSTSSAETGDQTVKTGAVTVPVDVKQTASPTTIVGVQQQATQQTTTTQTVTPPAPAPAPVAQPAPPSPKPTGGNYGKPTPQPTPMQKPPEATPAPQPKPAPVVASTNPTQYQCVSVVCNPHP